MRIHIAGMIAAVVAVLLLGAVPSSAQVAGMQMCPAPGGVALNLTPAQAAAVQRIVDAAREGLRVPVYDACQIPDGTLYGVPIAWITVDQAIALTNQQLQAELARRNPNPIAVEGLSNEIAALSTQRQVVAASTRQMLAQVLTPQQLAVLPPLWPVG